MTPTISVFGSSGFIGSHFCEYYTEHVIKIPRNQYHLDQYTPEILYLISTVDNYHIHNNLHIDINTNLTILMNVLNNLKEKFPHNCPTFNFISSWFVYGQNYEIPFREDFSQCNPTGFYSITKRCAEQMLICFCETFGIKYRIFRLANVIGEGDKKISKKKNALQYMIKEIVYDRPIDLYYNGQVLRDYIYVTDVTDALFHCINYTSPNQIYNIGNGIPYTFLNLLEIAIKESNSKSKINHINPSKFHDIVQVRHSYLDTTKLKNTGFVCHYPINDVIKQLVHHYQEEKFNNG